MVAGSKYGRGEAVCAVCYQQDDDWEKETRKFDQVRFFIGPGVNLEGTLDIWMNGRVNLMLMLLEL